MAEGRGCAQRKNGRCPREDHGQDQAGPWAGSGLPVAAPTRAYQAAFELCTRSSDSAGSAIGRDRRPEPGAHRDTTSWMLGRQDPHWVPAPVHSITSGTEHAPSRTASLISLSVTPMQRQTYIVVFARQALLKIAFNIGSVKSEGWGRPRRTPRHQAVHARLWEKRRLTGSERYRRGGGRRRLGGERRRRVASAARMWVARRHAPARERRLQARAARGVWGPAGIHSRRGEGARAPLVGTQTGPKTKNPGRRRRRCSER